EEDLLKGLTEEARKRKLSLRGVLIIGPEIPLWTYYVTVFLQEGDKMRVNTLIFPHARITHKSTGLLTADRYAKWLDGMLKIGVAKSEPPAAARKEKGGQLSDFGYTLLLAAWNPEGKDQKITPAAWLGRRSRSSSGSCTTAFSRN